MDLEAYARSIARLKLNQVLVIYLSNMLLNYTLSGEHFCTKEARMFDSGLQAVDTWNSLPADFPTTSARPFQVCGLMTSLAHVAIRWQLRKILAPKFHLHNNVSYAILADRCEDEGMAEESKALRLTEKDVKRLMRENGWW